MANIIGQSLGRYHILEHVSTSLTTSLGEACRTNCQFV